MLLLPQFVLQILVILLYQNTFGVRIVTEDGAEQAEHVNLI